MTTLTLIYTADSAGNFADPATGKRWDMPENEKFLRDTIADKSIICGRKTAEKDGQHFAKAAHCSVLTTSHDFFQSDEALPIFEAFKKSRPPVEQATRRAVAMGWLYVDGV